MVIMEAMDLTLQQAADLLDAYRKEHKLARIVDMFARRLQIQERMTEEIAAAVMAETGAEGVGVVIKAKHLCMMMRGVEKQNSEMTTSAVLGSFRADEKVRQEFLSLIK